MSDRLFLFDYKTGIEYTYRQLLDDVNQTTIIKENCYTKNLYDTMLSIITGILHKVDLTLLDADFSAQEMRNLNVKETDLCALKIVPNLYLQSIDEMVMLLNQPSSWTLTLFTSGTTGIPKKIVHPVINLVRAVRASEKHYQDIWGYAYNPTHIAGLQVFFQAILNGNTLINLFEAPRDRIFELIHHYHITNISATPTFYRLLLPITGKFETVKKLTSGGEKFDTNLSANLLQAFPNARLRNVYASTEAGTILESRDDMFSIVDESLCRIVEGELLIHSSMLGNGFEEAKAQSEWYATGDMVDIVETSPLRFRFLHRKNEMINVGGYKVNPYEVEQVMEAHPNIQQAYIYGKANPVLGSILMADIVISEPVTEKELRAYLAPLLQPYKIPRMINFVESIPLTRTGKMKRT